MKSINKTHLLQPRKVNQDYVDRRREARLPAHIPSILLQQGHTILHNNH